MKNCLNCDHPIHLDHKHCTECGQKTKFKKLRFITLVKDFFSNLFNIENKIWSSLKDIWVPAKLSRAFIAGRRAAYYHPLRFFLVVLFSFFTLTLLQFRDSLSELSKVTQIQEKNVWKEHYINNYDTLALDHEILRDTILKFKAKIFKKKEETIDSTETIDSSDFASEFKKGWDEVEPRDHGNIKISEEAENKTQNADLYYEGGAVKGNLFGDIKLFDLYRLTPNELKQKYGGGLWQKEFGLIQIQKIVKDLQSSVTFFIGNGTWAIILLVILISFVFYLLYWRRGYHYAEHFILQVNAHTRILLLGIILITAKNVIPKSVDTGWLNIIWSILSLFFMYKSLRNFYQQSRIKTFVKMIIALIFYVLILIICMLFILLLSGILL